MTKFHCPANDSFYQAGVYRPLQTENHEIRLLKILPGRKAEPSRCELIQKVPLKENPDYEALSYCAGSYKDTETIQLNGRNFNVFATLGQAIQRLRKLDKPRVLWADQICINQSDILERNHQVLQMQEVYRTAARAIVWLGGPYKYQSLSFSDDDLETIAIKLLKEIDCFQVLFKEGVQTQESSSIGATAKVWNHPETMEWTVDRLSEDSTYDTFCNAFEDMSNAPWWQRCWVQQELLVSKDAVIYWSNSSLPWDLLKVVSRIMYAVNKICWNEVRHECTASKRQTKPPKLPLLLLSHNSPVVMAERQDEWAFGSKRYLRHLLKISRALQSTDPRDRVYAFLGLTAPRNGMLPQDLPIVPDYSPDSTVESCFAQVVKTVVNNERSLDILSDGQEAGRTNSILPSWIPDYSIQQGRLANWHKILSLFGAASCEDPKCDIILKGDPPSRVLRVQVLFIGSLIPIPPAGHLHLMRARQRDNFVEFWFMERCSPEAETEHVNDVSFGEAPLCFTPGDELCYASANEISTVGSIEAVVATMFYAKLPVGSSDDEAGGLVRGISGKSIREGDEICVFLGASMLFVVRQRKEGGYALVSEALLEGFSNGRAVNEWKRGEREAGWIDLY